MARLARKKQKIFASGSAQNQVTSFGSIKAGAANYTKDVNNIQTAAFEGGWSDAVQDDYAPYRQDRNGVDYVTTSQLAYIFQEGISEWESQTTYFKGSVVKVVSGNSFKLYHSLIDNNVGKAVTDSESWSLDFDSSKKYAINQDVVHKAGYDNITGFKDFSGGMAVVGSGVNLYMKNPNADLTSTSIVTTTEIQFKDKNNLTQGIFEHQNRTNGDSVAIMAARNHANNAWATIDVGFDANDEIFTLAPPCSKVNSIIITRGISLSQNGYVRLGNGLIIQWGKVSQLGGSENREVAFPVAFKTTAIGVAGGSLNANSYEGQWGYAKNLTTMVVCNGSKSSKTDMQWIAVGY